MCHYVALNWFCMTDYVMKPNDGDFYGNVAELALYGYTLASSQSVLLAPENAVAAWRRSKVALTWTASPNAASYRVERKADGGAWTLASPPLTAMAIWRILLT